MLILACAEKKLRVRWKEALRNFESIIEVENLIFLKNKLRNTPETIILLHTSLPGLHGDVHIQELLKEYPDVFFFALSDVPDEAQGIELIRSGVLGYANSYINHESLREAIKVIQLGEIWVSKRLLKWLVNNCRETRSQSKTQGSFLSLETLTPSEQHVVQHLLEGNNNKDIARKLNITERTVKAHLTSIYSKTGTTDRLHLALLAQGYDKRQI